MRARSRRDRQPARRTDTRPPATTPWLVGQVLVVQVVVRWHRCHGRRARYDCPAHLRRRRQGQLLVHERFGLAQQLLGNLGGWCALRHRLLERDLGGLGAVVAIRHGAAVGRARHEFGHALALGLGLELGHEARPISRCSISSCTRQYSWIAASPAGWMSEPAYAFTTMSTPRVEVLISTLEVPPEPSLSLIACSVAATWRSWPRISSPSAPDPLVPVQVI